MIKFASTGLKVSGENSMILRSLVSSQYQRDRWTLRLQLSRCIA